MPQRKTASVFLALPPLPPGSWSRAPQRCGCGWVLFVSACVPVPGLGAALRGSGFVVSASHCAQGGVAFLLSGSVAACAALGAALPPPPSRGSATAGVLFPF